MQDKKNNRDLTKTGLKIIGVVLSLGGLACTIVGSVSFFSSLGSGTLPKLFWLLMIGLPMLTIGVAMLTFGFRRTGAPKQETPPNNATAESVPVMKTDEKALLCPVCGRENAAGLAFCEHCGAKLERRCPHCGKPVNADAGFCGHCGKQL